MTKEPQTVTIILSPLKAVKLNVIIKEYLRALESTIARQISHLPNENQDLELDVIASCEVQILFGLYDIPQEDILQENCDYNKVFREKKDYQAKNN